MSVVAAHRRPSAPLARTGPRRAFTLMEMLLAMAMSFFMILAIDQILFQSTWAMLTGREVAMEGQLARALMERMANDIRGATGGSGAFGVGVKGAADSLTLCTFVVPRDLDFSENRLREIPEGRGDMVEVTYRLRPGGEDSPAGGLLRTVRRHLAASRADVETNATEVLADEVVSLGFRYSNGGEWLESWDGSADAGAPKAIEIRMRLEIPDTILRDKDEEEEQEQEEKLKAETDIYGTEQAVNIYRLVVVVPAGAEPEGTIIRRDDDGGSF